MKKYVFLVLLVCIIVISTVVSRVMTLRNVPHLVSVQTVENLGLATFSDGVTHVLFHDYDYASMEPGWDVSTTIASVSADEGRQLPSYLEPQVTFKGSNWQREVYTYANEWDGCQKNILYINRDAKSSETIQKIQTDFCIDRTLDERDITKFFGTSEDQTMMVMGSYVDGSSIAKITLSELDVYSGPGLLASNWENTKLIFTTGICDRGGDSLQILLWDTQAGSLTDQRPFTPLRDCGQLEDIIYNHDKDAFDLYGSENGKQYVIGSIR